MDKTKQPPIVALSYISGCSSTVGVSGVAPFNKQSQFVNYYAKKQVRRKVLSF